MVMMSFNVLLFTTRGLILVEHSQLLIHALQQTWGLSAGWHQVLPYLLLGLIYQNNQFHGSVIPPRCSLHSLN
jgi:hypothetical protein